MSVADAQAIEMAWYTVDRRKDAAMKPRPETARETTDRLLREYESRQR